MRCLVGKDLDLVFPIWITQCDRVWFTHTMPPYPCRAPTVLLCELLLKATAQHGRGTAWYVWINMAVSVRPVGDPFRFGFFWLPRGVSRVAVRIFPGTCRLSRRTRHCWWTAGAQHGICDVARHDRDTARVRHGMYELASRGSKLHVSLSRPSSVEFWCTVSWQRNVNSILLGYDFTTG